jgi:putative pyruvate formate lyase activating enzyme
MTIELPESCALCPRRCGVNRAAGERGVCGADDTLRIARAALHLWEEPVISVGAGSGTVFFSGCPLRCCYCQNADISMGRIGVPVSFDRLVEIFLELQDRQNAANINLVTPTQYMPWIVPAIAQARARGLRVPVVYNTSGYETA